MSGQFKAAHEGGFTLVEIAAAITLLGIGLTALIGLQIMYADRYYHERNLTRAALYAQYLVTDIETNPTLPQPGAKQSDLKEALENAGYFEAASDLVIPDSVDGWTMNQSVESIDVLDKQDALRRINLRVGWTESPHDSFELIYYIPGDPKPSQQSGTTG